MIGVLIVTDARFHREGLAESLSRSAVVRVVGTAADFEGVRPLLTEPGADVMLLDDLPNAIAVTRHVVREAAVLRVVALGLRETDHDVVAWAEPASQDSSLATSRSGISSQPSAMSPRVSSCAHHALRPR